jgi:carbonic anhydrase
MFKSDSKAEATRSDAPILNRRDFARVAGVSALGLAVTGCAVAEEPAEAQVSSEAPTAPVATTQTAASQAAMTPDEALEMLREGNQRFASAQPLNRDFAQQIQATAAGQYPFAFILGCVDSRVPIEVVFDQGVGDVFTARVAGNVMNEDMLGSMEFACNLAGAKAIVVLGHTSCGAVKGSIAEVRIGNLTDLVEKIEPAVESVTGERDVTDLDYVDRVAEANVALVLRQIRDESPLLVEMEQAGDIALVGAMYDVSSGEVRFL